MGELVTLRIPFGKLNVRIAALHGNQVVRMAHTLHDRAHPFTKLTPVVLPHVPGQSRPRIDHTNHLASYDYQKIDPRDLAEALDEDLVEHPLPAGLPAGNPLTQAGDFKRSLDQATLRATPVQRIVVDGRAAGSVLTEHPTFATAVTATIANMMAEDAHPLVALCRGDGAGVYGFMLCRTGALTAG